MASTQVAVPPGAPKITKLTSGNKQISVYFSSPTVTGGAPVKYYEYSVKQNNVLFPAWTSWAPLGNINKVTPSPLVSPIVISGLNNGSTYSVKIRAVNIAGSGTESSTVDAVPATTPAAPIISNISFTPASGGGHSGQPATPSSYTVSFVPPADNGGSAITGYKISSNGGASFVSAVAVNNAITVNLPRATIPSYSFIIKAINAIGEGLQSVATYDPPITVPDAPVVAVDSPRYPSYTAMANGKLTIRFTAPANNGGAAITGYSYSFDGGSTWTSTNVLTSPMVFNGSSLPARPFTFKMKAVNPAGSSAAATRTIIEQAVGVHDAVPAATVPDAPSIAGEPRALGVVLIKNNQLTINFGAPTNNGGSAITGYDYSLDGGSTWTRAASMTSPMTFSASSLPDRPFVFKLRAVNAVGAGNYALKTIAG